MRTGMETWKCLTLLLLALPSVFSNAFCSTGPLLYPFGEHHGDEETPKLDDGGTDLIHLSHAFQYKDDVHRDLYVNNNGAISFYEPVTSYTPDVFPLEEYCMICPFWGDVDNEYEGEIWYRQTHDKDLLERISEDVRRAFPNLKEYDASWAFIATWDRVHYHGSLSNKTNTFQVVLASDRFLKSIVMFNYEDIQWLTGTASGGDPMSGMGGDAAQAGFNDRTHYLNMPLSRTDQMLGLPRTSNVECSGRWIFRVDDEWTAPGGCLYKDSFLNFGQVMWDSDSCSNKCSCKLDGKVSCEEKGCDEGMVCLPAGRNFLCQIDEENC